MFTGDLPKNNEVNSIQKYNMINLSDSLALIKSFLSKIFFKIIFSMSIFSYKTLFSIIVDNKTNYFLEKNYCKK